MSAGVESIEVERKYEVAVDAVLPGDFSPAGLLADEPEQVELRAVYFDTADGHLARSLVAVRRREGGHDAGWHLKAKGAGGARELHWPLSDEMPEGLRAEIAQLSDAPVVPLAELRTQRTVLRLRDGRAAREKGGARGAEAVELADDRVLAEHCSTGVRRAWREWEAELAQGADAALLDRLEPLLRQSGATPSANPAKIVRAVGLIPQFDARDREAARRLGV